MLLSITKNPCKNTCSAILQSLIYVHRQGSAIKGRFFREKVKIASMLKKYAAAISSFASHTKRTLQWLKSAQARGKSASQLMLRLAGMLKP